MTKDKSRLRILQEWERWAPDPNLPDPHKMFEFYIWLEKNHPDLLTWKVREGVDRRWQSVRGWLNVRTDYAHRG
jgi:hypothetical protein